MKSSKKQQKPPAKENGRPRDDFSTKVGIEAFAATWHFPLSVVKLTKKAGGEGFLSGGRVDPLLAIPAVNDFIAANDKLPDGCKSWREVGDKFRGLHEKLNYEKKNEQLMVKTDAVRFAGEAGALFMGQLERLARELPPALAGMPASSVAARMETEFENVRRHLKIKMQEIGK